MERIAPFWEYKLIEYLRKIKPYDSGGSRIVFEADHYIKMILNLDETKDYVVKVALGLGGMSQNTSEVEAYIRTNYDNTHLAEIFAIGRYCLIMEEVDVDCEHDLAEYIDSFETRYVDTDNYLEDNFCEDEEITIPDKVIDTIGFLADIFGCTADNGQIGWTKDDRCVAFDYGFYADVGCDAQTSDLRDMIYDSEILDKYLLGLMDILNLEDNVFTAFTQSRDESVAQLEAAIIRGEYEDEEFDEEY